MYIFKTLDTNIIHNKVQELSTSRIQIKWLIKGIYGNNFCCFYACDGHYTLPHSFYTWRRFFMFSFYFVTLRDVFVRSSWIFFFSSSLRSRSSSIFSRSWTVTLSLLQNKYALAFCSIIRFWFLYFLLQTDFSRDSCKFIFFRAFLGQEHHRSCQPHKLATLRNLHCTPTLTQLYCKLLIAVF